MSPLLFSFYMIKKAFTYIENLWIGVDGKISLRACLAIAFSVDFIRNLSFSIHTKDTTRTLEGVSLVLGIEAGLIVALLGLTAYSNLTSLKIETDSNKALPDIINVKNAEINNTKADTLKATNVNTVNSQNTTISSKDMDEGDI